MRNSEQYRSFGKIVELLKNNIIDKIQAVFLADKLHPIIGPDFQSILKDMNSNLSGINFTHEKVSDLLSEPNLF